MKITDDVLTILSTLQVDGKAVKIVDQLDRAAYAKVNKVLEAIGGKWSRSARAHLFSLDPRQRLDLVITTGEVETGQDVGLFSTPEPLAARLAALADVAGQHCLEPSAGRGRLCKAMQDAGAATVTAVEWLAENRAYLRAHDLADTVISVPDVMEFTTIDRPFDRVVMNPPFCKVGVGDHLDHVRHCYDKLLKPGGILVSVLPSSVEFRQDRRYREFREWVQGSGSIESLPAGSFKPSGTGVNTCVVRIVR